MANLLKLALDEQRYDLAAHVLVYGLIKTVIKENGKQRRAKTQSERTQTRLLQPRPK